MTNLQEMNLYVDSFHQYIENYHTGENKKFISKISDPIFHSLEKSADILMSSKGDEQVMEIFFYRDLKFFSFDLNSYIKSFHLL
ncbi:hypothetical protein M153_100013547 [Pseudoloma neurophilia]|uniref:Uncharacterized protein n=1 Tax=Pseudoloma neurophilia TaxID=146866 RepID=A0A0R0M6Y0_9MICR|nr:hypothetical protein M153_100013547 [Pseudoloma neurophilia]